MAIALLDEQLWFPPLSDADDELGGLLAVGGDLSVARLQLAYQSAIFPWFSDGDPLLWWSPAERCIILPEQFHCSKSLAKRVRHGGYTVTSDRAFDQVVAACARRGHATRNQRETWIVPAMQAAYSALHSAGSAHSIELWHADKLVAGLYGVQVGAMFCGESMYSDVTDGSKLVLYHLCKALAAAGFSALDCQLHSPHLESLGAVCEPRAAFLARLGAARSSASGWPIIA